jgi:hypothetical protein
MFTSLREAVEALDASALPGGSTSDRGLLERLEGASGLVGRDVGGDADSSLPRALSHQVTIHNTRL